MSRRFPTLLLMVLLASALAVGAWFAIKPGRGNTPGDAPITLPPSMPGSLRVMTANIRLSDPTDGVNVWTNRRELVVKTFLKYQPDILGCQEVSPAQGAYLNKELAGGYAYYPRAGIGTVADSPTGSGAGGGTAAHMLATLGDALATLNTLYFRNDRFEVIDGEAGLILPEEPQATASENTFFTLAILREKMTTPAAKGPPLRLYIVVDIHFRHGEEFAIHCAGRLREKLVAWQNKYPAPKPEIIVLGDINHDRTSKLYPFLVGNAPTLIQHDPLLVDAFDYDHKGKSDAWGTFHNFTGNIDRAWPTDLIFYSGHLQAAPNGAAQILRDHAPPPQNRWPSDHFFVMADLIPG